MTLKEAIEKKELVLSEKEIKDLGIISFEEFNRISNLQDEYVLGCYMDNTGKYIWNSNYQNIYEYQDFIEFEVEQKIIGIEKIYVALIYMMSGNYDHELKNDPDHSDDSDGDMLISEWRKIKSRWMSSNVKNLEEHWKKILVERINLKTEDMAIQQNK